jgi:hypothetical protein
MPDPIDRFLSHRPTISDQSGLGRRYGVVRQSWPLEADPGKVRPRRLIVASGRSASEAADIARSAAGDFATHGFHKPSGAWWGVAEGRFHRFMVTSHRPRRSSIMVGMGVLGLAALALAKSRRAGA